MTSNFFVLDTNNLISAALIPSSTSRKALDKARLLGILIVSNKTIEEFNKVLFRSKFDRYFVNDSERWLIFNKVKSNAKIFIPTITINECRDPKDNKFLELAVAAKASCIITGDKDLLELHPFRDIPILNAFDFLNNF